MTRFTNSLYERMMTQKPQMGRLSEMDPPRFRPSYKCHGCPYGRDRPCIGLCLKDIQAKEAGNEEPT